MMHDNNAQDVHKIFVPKKASALLVRCAGTVLLAVIRCQRASTVSREHRM